MPRYVCEYIVRADLYWGESGDASEAYCSVKFFFLLFYWYIIFKFHIISMNLKLHVEILGCAALGYRILDTILSHF